MYIYSISSDQVTALKDQIFSQGVDTDGAGMTEVTIRKMILTYAVTSSTQDTLCVAEVSEDEILKGTEYTDLNKYFNSCTKKNSKDIFPIDNYKYDLYYITDSFFYFKDKKDMIGNGDDKYYLGIMGSIDVVSETGDEFGYVSNTEFDNIKERYLNKSDKSGSQEEFDLLHHYTIDSSGQMTIYKIIENKNTYSYTFKNNKTNTKIEKKDLKDGNSTESVVQIPLDIQGSVDTSKYAVSIEFLMDFLNMTASPQYLDEFIDYAIEKTKVTIKGYSLNNKETTYSKKTYNIEDNFIFELYDMVDGTDSGQDNMITYKTLIHDRIYEGRPFESSVVDLPNFEDIDYNENQDAIELMNNIKVSLNFTTNDMKVEFANIGYDTEEKVRDWINSTYYNQYDAETVETVVQYIFNGGELSNVKKISKYLLAAYDPRQGFSLGDVSVEQKSKSEKFETTWEFYLSNISTWYGNIIYEDAVKTKEYGIDNEYCTLEEYNEFNASKLTKYKDMDSEDKTKIYICDARARRSRYKQ